MVALARAPRIGSASARRRPRRRCPSRRRHRPRRRRRRCRRPRRRRRHPRRRRRRQRVATSKWTSKCPRHPAFASMGRIWFTEIVALAA
eukprot:scaffold133415_cov74-Phaeocystis_antarctica.AAC.1